MKLKEIISKSKLADSPVENRGMKIYNDNGFFVTFDRDSKSFKKSNGYTIPSHVFDYDSRGIGEKANDYFNERVARMTDVVEIGKEHGLKAALTYFGDTVKAAAINVYFATQDLSSQLDTSSDVAPKTVATLDVTPKDHSHK